MTGNDIFVKVLGRIALLQSTSGISFIDALNTAIEVIFLRLWARRSDIVKDNLSISISTTPFTLPSDFRGLAEDPYLVNYEGTQSIDLSPLPSGKEFDMFLSTETPMYYRLNGFSLSVLPYTESQITADLEMIATLEITEMLEMRGPTTLLPTHTLKGQYFSAPDQVTMDSTIPWGGIFDGLIADATVQATMIGGVTSLLANPAFLASVDQALDNVLNSRTNPAPRRTTPKFF